MAFGLNGYESSELSFKNSFPIWEVLEFAQREGFEGIELVPNWPHKDIYVNPADEAKINSLRGFFAPLQSEDFFDSDVRAGGLPIEPDDPRGLGPAVCRFRPFRPQGRLRVHGLLARG